MLNIGWFSTGRGEGSRSLLRIVYEHIRSGNLEANIEFVFSNRETGEANGSDAFHAMVKSYNLPLVTLSSQKFRKEKNASTFNDIREEFDQAALKRLDEFSPDLCILAGYMLFTTQEFCKRYTLINLHPAAPGGPVGTWQEVIWQTIGQNATHAGAQIQLATINWDRGPIITYCTFPISGPLFDPLWEKIKYTELHNLKLTYGEKLPLFEQIRSEGLRRETPLLLETIKAFAEKKVNVVEEDIVDKDGWPTYGIDLTNAIEKQLKNTMPKNAG